MIFIDTGAFLALYLKRDHYHRQAIKTFPSIPRPFSTSNHIVDEVATLLGRIAGYRYAADRIDDRCASESIDALSSTRGDEIEAIRWMRKYADKGVSFTDCVSFVMMRRLGIRTVFTSTGIFAMRDFRSSTLLVQSNRRARTIAVYANPRPA